MFIVQATGSVPLHLLTVVISCVTHFYTSLTFVGKAVAYQSRARRVGLIGLRRGILNNNLVS
jgi:hypothetical protein